MDRVLCSKEVEFQFVDQQIFGKTPTVIEKPERIQKLGEKFKIDKFQNAVPVKNGKASIFPSSRFGIKLEFEI